MARIQKDRIYFSPDISSRGSTDSTTYTPKAFLEDGFIKNGVFLKNSGEDYSHIITRPCINWERKYDLNSSAVQSGNGRGAYYWETTNAVYSIIGRRIFKNGVALEYDTGVFYLLGDASTTSKIYFDQTLESGGYAVFHDGTHIYKIDSSDVMLPLNPDEWQTSTTYNAGEFVWNDTDNVYICVADGNSSGGPTGTGSGISDGTVTWDYVGELTSGHDNIPTAMVPGIVVLDQYLFVADSDGNIYNSNVADIDTWTAGDQINAELLADDLKTIARHHNYLVAFGSQGTQFFYDAANATGSPLDAVDGSFFYIGCASGNSVVNAGNTVVWVAQNQAGQRQLMKLQGFQPQPLANTSMSKWLNTTTPTMWEGCYMSFFGKDYYCVWSSATATAVYDLTENYWYHWNFDSISGLTGDFNPRAMVQMPTSESNIGSFFLNYTSVNGADAASTWLVHYMSETHTQDATSNSTDDVLVSNPLIEIQTGIWDANTTDTKFIHRIYVLADSMWFGSTPGSSSSDRLTMKWQDEDDLNTSSRAVVYKGSRLVDMGPGRKFITRCGSCRERRFYLSNANVLATFEDFNWRVRGLEIHYTLGKTGALNAAS